MVIIMNISFVVLLFLFIYTAVRGVIVVVCDRVSMRSRLHYIRSSSMMSALHESLQQTRYRYLHRHLADLLESIRSTISASAFLYLSLVMLTAGLCTGSFVFDSLKGAAVVGFIFMLAPYLTVRTRVISQQMKTRIEFLPAVEVFYQAYVMSSHKNIRSVIQDMSAEGRLRYSLKLPFEQLHRHLSMQREADDSLRIFALSIGHIWAEYFIRILRFALLEGVDVTDNLKELIADMRKAQLADQIERNRLLEIRLASFSSVFFLGLFLAVNFKMNAQQSYFYYMVDPAGRNLLLDAVLYIFASFLMGIYFSIRRM